MKVLSFHCIAVLCLTVPMSASSDPSLSIPGNIPCLFGVPVAVPILFAGNGAEISAMVFSIDYDEACLEFNDGDADADGVPDDIVFSLPAQFSGGVFHEPGDVDGELDFVIADFGLPLASLPDGEIAFVIFTPTCQPDRTSIIARVGFSEDPPASFGDASGQGVEGATSDGSIEIFFDTPAEIFADGFESGDTAAWLATVVGS